MCVRGEEGLTEAGDRAQHSSQAHPSRSHPQQTPSLGLQTLVEISHSPVKPFLLRVLKSKSLSILNTEALSLPNE